MSGLLHTAAIELNLIQSDILRFQQEHVGHAGARTTAINLTVWSERLRSLELLMRAAVPDPQEQIAEARRERRP